jgi:hypothetical protein
MILSGAFALLLSGALPLAQSYTVTNNCPTAIELFIAGVSQGSLATGASVEDDSGGFYYTSTNGGFASDGRLVGSRVGFFTPVSIALLHSSYLQLLCLGALLVLLHCSGRQPQQSQHGNVSHPNQLFAGMYRQSLAALNTNRFSGERLLQCGGL